MTYWNSKGMSACRSELDGSAKRMRRIAEDCMAEYSSGERDAAEKKQLRELAELLLAAVRLETSIMDSIPVIDSIYRKNEQKTADYFDLVVRHVPRTELGISILDSLREHEEQMPFETKAERSKE